MATLNLMIAALSERDQKVGLAAAEFWSGLLNHDDASFLKTVKYFMPKVLSELLQCCVFTTADKMDIVETKDDDLVLNRGGE